MGRMLRPRLPGVPFHITARTQGHGPLFAGAEGQIVALVLDSIRYSDTELVAYAVMPNHIHLVAVQGRRPLGEFMQPLLRRIALLIGRRSNQRGHVFHGRYAHSVCHDPDYFRSMIAYVHLNPARAGMCRTPDRYPWTSHTDYANGTASDAPVRYALAVQQAVRVFARASEQPEHDCRKDYRAFVRWRLAMDQYLMDSCDSFHPIPREPLAIGGDLHWHREYGSARSLRMAGAGIPAVKRIDLRDHVRIALRDLDPQFPLEMLRSGGSSRPLIAIRRQVIARALSAGYSGSSVADFLNISPASVSRVKSQVRAGVAL
jgi:REP element-mobilizing transposase RayT